MSNSDVNRRSNYWLLVFNNSKVNGAPYGGDNLPARSWRWPTETYLQRRLRWLRANGGDHLLAAPKGSSERQEPRTERDVRALDLLPAHTIH